MGEFSRTQTLVSIDANGGHAWWHDGSEESTANHYDGFIPWNDVEQKLLDWSPEQLPIHVDVPTDNLERADNIADNGDATYRVTVPGKSAIVRSDTGEVLGINSDSYRIHDYSDHAYAVAHNLVGETLGITSAGLLRNGAQFYFSVSHETAFRDDLTGIDFASFIGFSTSLDGSMATQYNIGTTLPICQNTLELFRAETDNGVYRRKHTAHSRIDITDVRQALNLIDERDEEFQKELRYLTEIEVGVKELEVFLSQWAPVPDEPGRGRTRAENKRDKFMDLYRNSDMCRDWQGTAFGVLQTANTFEHHVSEIRGGTRGERIRESIITGKMRDKDIAAHKMMLVAVS